MSTDSLSIKQWRFAVETATEFDVHAELHQSEDRETCEECQINRQHAERWAAAGPDRDVRALQEQHRLDWIEWADKRQPEGTGPLHDKEAKIKAFIVEHHRQDITLQQLMEETGAAQGTAYSYIREMPDSFRKVGTSRWRVTDPVRARVEAATMPQDAPAVVAGIPVPRDPNIANDRPKAGPSKP
jgi:hypothetical protein